MKVKEAGKPEKRKRRHTEEKGTPKKEDKTPSTRSGKDLLVLDSTQMASPIKDVSPDGIILTKDGRYVQIIELSPINFGLYPIEDQRAIANAFGSILQTFPRHIQIKILSRKADVQNHIDDLLHAKESETNELCRQLQNAELQKIKDYAVQSVSRRYFLAYEYEPDGFRSSNWPEIRAGLNATGAQISGFLGRGPCNNKLINRIGDPDSQLEILYQCFCREESQVKPFREKINEVVFRYWKSGKLVSDDYNIPVNDFICPQGIYRSNPFYLKVDNKFYAFGYIDGNSYPLSVPIGWLSQFNYLGEGIDVDIFLEKKDPSEITRGLSMSMQLGTSDLANKSSSSADLDLLKNKQMSSEYIRSKLAARYTLFDFYVMITVTADSPSELRWRLNAVKQELRRQDLTLTLLHTQHEEAFMTSLPICNVNKKLLKKARRNVMNDDFGSAYPFTGYEINDKGGIMVGVNLDNGSPVYLNFYDRSIYTSGNMVLLGTTGSGKTYALQTLAVGLREMGVKVIIITPWKGFDYEKACRAVGGQFIPLYPGSPYTINLMEIRKYGQAVRKTADGDEIDQGSYLMSKIQQIEAFFSILKPDMNPAERQALDEALITTYRRFGITAANKSLIDPQNPTQYKKMPTFSDLDQELSNHSSASALRLVLDRFVRGSARNFTGQTNVNLNNKYVVLDLSKTPKELLAVVQFIADDYAFDVMRATPNEPKAIFNDELSRMIGIAGSAAAAESVLNNYKIARGYSTIIISATQDTNDFFALHDGLYGKGIMANAKIKLILKQEKQEAETVGEILGLSRQEIESLTEYERGDGLLVANQNHANIHILASDMLHELIKTDT